MLGLEKGKVRIVAYDPEWPRRFVEERDELVSLFRHAELSPRIEHVGSTSIAGMPAKPVLDLALGFASPREVDRALSVLIENGRDYVKAANQPGMLFVAKGEIRTHHYHLTIYGSHAWRKLIVFRDHLRRHAGLRAEYAALKARLADKHADSRLEYTRAKTPFLTALLRRALMEDRERRHAAALKREYARHGRALP